MHTLEHSIDEKNYSTALASIVLALHLADGRRRRHETSTHFIPLKASKEWTYIRRRKPKIEETRRAKSGISPANVNTYSVNIARQGIQANELIPPGPVKLAEHNMDAMCKVETSQVLPQLSRKCCDRSPAGRAHYCVVTFP